MDIVRLKGGLGNQMFQYAFAESLRKRGRRVCCNLGYYRKAHHSGDYRLESVFSNVNLDEIDDASFDKIDIEWQRIRDDENAVNEFKADVSNRFFWVEDPSEEGKYTDRVYDTKSCTFVGFWQTYKYFDSIKKDICDSFAFKEDTEDLRHFRSLLESGPQYISVHIRRGDYLLCSEIFGGICTDSYYESAMYFFRNKYPSPVFVFFSDDIEWVKNRYTIDNAIYVTPNDFAQYDPWYDMYLMTLCRGNIIANSTFSWWGAWLNIHDDKTVVAPSKWSNLREMPDICPADWIRI